MRTFADIPGHVRERVNRGEPVLLILLDAFGMVFLERHRDHPLLSRVTLTELSSQIPSTTTAHVTTLHSGLPVAEHGLYEWALYEPTLDTIINPLPFRLAGDAGREGLAGRLDPRCLLDAPTFYQSLSVPSAVVQPTGLETSSYSRLVTAGAQLRADHEDLTGAVRDLLAELGDGRIGYGHLYWPDIDTASHHYGPDSPEVHAAIRHALDAIEAALRGAPAGVRVMITADHGQTAVSPQRVDLLDREWPELAGHLTQARPAGSARDTFLHVHADSVATVIDELSARLEGRATVRRAAELFDAISPRLAARLAEVAVLPADGRSTWLASALPAPAETNLGSHGGLTEAETATHLCELLT